ncbi:MAG: peptidoglycan DD-metalloendopeptidase family protein [Lachnospiraceae bacterium]
MQRGKKVFSFILVGVLSFTMGMPAYAASLSETKKKADALESQKKAAEEEQSSLSVQLNKIVGEMQQAEADLVKKQDEIAQAEDELVAAKVKENDQYESMKKRIRFMYENGNTEFLEILVKADSISDFLNQAEYVTLISTYDRKMLAEFQNLVKQVEEKEAALQKEREQLEVLQNSLIEKQTQVQALLASKSTEIANLESEIGANAKVLQNLIAEAAAAAKRKEEAASDKNHGGSSGGSAGSPVISGNGQLSWPCPGARVSSEFGPRKAPTAGASTYHNGMDFAAGSGTPIYAAAEGTVITAGYNSARGKYVVINHGGGLQTWYQHASALYVSAGAQVSRGQNIAAVGQTGISSGAHLHFEVHANGTPVNPRKYL